MTGPSAYRLRRQQPPSSSKPGHKLAPSHKPVILPVDKDVPESEDMRDPYRLPVRTQEAWQSALELQEKCSDKKIDGLQNFGYVMENEGKLHHFISLGAACYATLGSGPEYFKHYIGDEKGYYKTQYEMRLGKPLYFVDFGVRCFTPNMAYTVSKELALRWAEFVATKSIWRRAFITKDPEELITKPAIFHTCHPMRFVISAAMTLRYLYEHSKVIETWDVLRQCMPGTAAFYLANHVRIVEGSFRYQWTGGHAIFDRATNIDQKQVFTSLYTRDFSKMKGSHSMYASPWSYSGLQKIWCNGDAETSLSLPKAEAGVKTGGFYGNDSRTWKDIPAFCQKFTELNLIKEEKPNA